ncbi:MAG: amidoligase family protein [Shimia sp.]
MSYAPLPIDPTRLVGVEIEFAGLDEVQVARVVAETLGGTVQAHPARLVCVDGTALGTIQVEIDSALRHRTDNGLAQAALDLAADIVPVEIVTPPLARDAMPDLDRLTEALRAAGATGSREGVLKAFGVHLNPGLAHEAHTLATIRAYGLLEDWLRQSADIDPSRRVLPFVDPWPRGFVDQLVALPPATLAEVMRLAARHLRSRNYGLDLMPLLGWHDPEAFHRFFPDIGKTSPRPTFHFRLPDCRIDEPGWSIAASWALWHRVEAVAADAALLAELSRAWEANRAQPAPLRARWADRVAALLGERAPA